MTGGFSLHTSVVQGRLAYAMRRAAAARTGEFGLQILTLPQLAARLAGGLKRPASRESIEAGIIGALARRENLLELSPVHDMPGMTRALVRTLRNIWRAGFDLRTPAYRDNPRIRDLSYVEDVIRDTLEPGEYLPPDLEQLARAQIATAKTVLGPVVLDGIHGVERLWRPLIEQLHLQGGVVWHAPEGADIGWFKGDVWASEVSAPKQLVFSCANPAHEALEAMRWARSVIASGAAKPSEIAIAATSTSAWDDAFVALSAESLLPISFVGGRPALTTWDGQRCAALADALHNGLSQARVRRLLSLASREGTNLSRLPDGDLPVPGEASLSTAADWERALVPLPEYASVLVPILQELEKGPDAAVTAADMLLRGYARQLWDEALRRAPATALLFTLDSLRTPDERDPAATIAWCSADELAAAPRPFVWLLGLTSTDWPRSARLDPVLPGYIIPPAEVEPETVDAVDRRCFSVIRDASRQLILSTSRLNVQGSKASASPLLPSKIQNIYRDRIPRHAISESDRLLARPDDVPNDALAARAIATWRDWSRKELTAHDGQVGVRHSMLATLLTKPQSATSLSLLLRDPLAYVWYYAFGWRDLRHKERGLTLPADDYGRLVHELLKQAVDALEPRPGFASAQPHEIENVLSKAADRIITGWPQEINVPPPILWRNTVHQAREMAFAALTFEPFTDRGIRSWTEVPFGGEVRDPISRIDLPWDYRLPVLLPGTDIAIVGSIDRLDLWPGNVEIHVNDYKTGAKPDKAQNLRLGRGREVQRVLYDLACRTLLGTQARRVARLIYLRPPLVQFPLNNADEAIEALSGWVSLARTVLESGTFYPGVVSREDDPRFGRLAMPASSLYLSRKDPAIRAVAGSALVKNWKAP